MIRKVDEHSDFGQLARLLNEAFATIAEEFGLTKENSPTSNAFITADMLQSQLTENREFYYCEDNGNIIGFIAIEESLRESGTFYIENGSISRLQTSRNREAVDGFCNGTYNGTRWETHLNRIDKQQYRI